MSILVVEDDSAIRTMLVEVLEDEGYPVAEASDGAEALTYLEQSPQRPCLIVLDLMMPRMNGWQFREIQREDPALSDIPVILLSARPDMSQHMATIGADAYIPKPVDLDMLIEVVQRYCPNGAAK